MYSVLCTEYILLWTKPVIIDPSGLLVRQSYEVRGGSQTAPCLRWDEQLGTHEIMHLAFISQSGRDSDKNADAKQQGAGFQLSGV